MTRTGAAAATYATTLVSAVQQPRSGMLSFWLVPCLDLRTQRPTLLQCAISTSAKRLHDATAVWFE